VSAVIPVILRPCHWTGLPFGKLQAATKDAKPVEKYPSLDDTFLEITQNIEKVAKRINSSTAIPLTATASPLDILKNQPEMIKSELPRSSNLAIPKTFTDHDKDSFVIDAFDFMAKYFKGSLEELKNRNPESINFRFQRVDARSFEAAIYCYGKQVSQCGIWLGNFLGSKGIPSIMYLHSGLGQGNSFNESMSVKDNGNMLGLEPMGMGRFSGTEKKPLTNEGAAEYYWSMFFEPMQRG